MSSVVLIGYSVDMFFVTPNINVLELDLYRLIPYRSADQARVVVPRVNLERFGRRVFSWAESSPWKSHSLYTELRSERLSGHFREDPKTFLFKAGFYTSVYDILLISLQSQRVYFTHADVM